MKKYINGHYIEMTQAEIEELKAKAPEIVEELKDETADRLDKIEKALEKFSAVLERLGVK